MGTHEAADALTEKIGNQEPYPPLDLIKWMKKEESIIRQERWERGENEMKNRKTSVSWQNDTVQLSRKEQVIISRLRTEYTRATHRHIIEKTDKYYILHINTQRKRQMQDPMHSMEGGKRRQQEIG
jgi:hypothetical protein